MKTLLITAFLGLTAIASPVEAGHHHPKGPLARLEKLLGKYPARGSAEEAKELATLLELQKTRTEEQCRVASLEAAANLNNLFGKHHKLLTDEEIEWIDMRILGPDFEADHQLYMAKWIYKRPRPYTTWPEVTPCIPKDKSLAYPSGHATSSRMYARVLSKFFPERAEAFMKRADEAAMLRLIGGVHHPSDIEAGKKLGDWVAKKYMATKKWKLLIKELNKRDPKPAAPRQ